MVKMHCILMTEKEIYQVTFLTVTRDAISRPPLPCSQQNKTISDMAIKNRLNTVMTAVNNFNQQASNNQQQEDYNCKDLVNDSDSICHISNFGVYTTLPTIQNSTKFEVYNSIQEGIFNCLTGGACASPVEKIAPSVPNFPPNFTLTLINYYLLQKHSSLTANTANLAVKELYFLSRSRS